MARTPANETIEIAPTSNVYTALLAAATVGVLIGLIVLFVRAAALSVSFW